MTHLTEGPADGFAAAERYDEDASRQAPALRPSKLARNVARVPRARPALPGPVGELIVAEPSRQLDALRRGAQAVVPPGVGEGALDAVIEATRHGFAVLPVAMLRQLVPLRASPLEPAALGPSLTPREQAVLQLLSEGATNKMIARALDISVHTAKFHVASILEKLDAVTRTDAVAQGIRQGLLML